MGREAGKEEGMKEGRGGKRADKEG